jgi:hypothetical protein
MAYFFDTSALVKRDPQEDGTAVVDAAIENPRNVEVRWCHSFVGLPGPEACAEQKGFCERGFGNTSRDVLGARSMNEPGRQRYLTKITVLRSAQKRYA